MRANMTLATLIAILLLASTNLPASASTCVAQPSPTVPRLALAPVASGFSAPIYVTGSGDGSGRLFVVEKAGLIRIVVDGQVLAEPFLDVRDFVRTESEQGLLGLTFHPDYSRNGRFFVYYSAKGEPRSVVAEYLVSSADPNRAHPEGKVILEAPQPEGSYIHKAGHLEFGPDGYLYISLGDGGAPTPTRAPDSLLGAILRIDVDTAEPYAIPADNPFAGSDGIADEIWSHGFRNPWRFSFDPCGRLFVGDVGDTAYEEISLVEAGGDYGWPFLEGNRCTRLGGQSGLCGDKKFTNPLHTYGHLHLDPEGGNAVVGGYTYRGSKFPELVGRYLFLDVYANRMWTLTATSSGFLPWGPQTWRLDQVWQGDAGAFVSFGEGDDRELYVVSHDSGVLAHLTIDTTD